MKSLDDIPSVIFPEKSGEYKHIQVTIKGKDFLRFDYTSNIHGEILEDLLKSCNIKFEYKDTGSGKIPLEKSADYELVGAGIALVNLNKQSVTCDWHSHHYQKRTNENHLSEIAKCNPGWTFIKKN